MKANLRRARRAQKAIVAYGKDDTLETIYRDILTDLMHFAHQRKIDFDAALWMAKDHFREETREDK